MSASSEARAATKYKSTPQGSDFQGVSYAYGCSERELGHGCIEKSMAYSPGEPVVAGPQGPVVAKLGSR